MLTLENFEAPLKVKPADRRLARLPASQPGATPWRMRFGRSTGRARAH